MNALLSVWSWLEIGVVSLVGFLLQVVLVPLTWPWDRRRLVTGRLFRLCGVVASRLNPYWRFGVYGEVRRPGPRTVVVSNHESNADPFLISFLPWEMKWLGKAVLFRAPVLGWSMYLAGDIPVERGDSDSARGAMSRCAQWLDKGVPVMIFPEGTRSPTGELLPFKDGAFRLAIEQQADILPIAVYPLGEAVHTEGALYGTLRRLPPCSSGSRLGWAGRSAAPRCAQASVSRDAAAVLPPGGLFGLVATGS